MHDFCSPEHAISIVMPVHNGGVYLQSAVNSILRQKRVVFELIIVDDNSTDGAIESLRKDPRIKLISSTSRGIVAALNTGIKRSTSPFIARMDADDIASSIRLNKQLQHYQDVPGLDICGTKVKVFNHTGTVAAGYHYYQEWINSCCSAEQIDRDFFVESTIPHPSAMIRHSLLESLGGYRESEWPEDYDLWCRALMAGAVFGKPDAPNLIHWRDHDTRLSRTDARYSKNMFLKCKAYYLSRRLKQRGISQCTILGAGSTGLKMHDFLEDNGMDICGFIDINQNMKGRLKRGKSVYITATHPNQTDMSQFKSNKKSIIISAVNSRGAREKIRSYLNKSGLDETKDYLMAA